MPCSVVVGFQWVQSLLANWKWEESSQSGRQCYCHEEGELVVASTRCYRYWSTGGKSPVLADREQAWVALSSEVVTTRDHNTTQHRNPKDLYLKKVFQHHFSFWVQSCWNFMALSNNVDFQVKTCCLLWDSTGNTMFNHMWYSFMQSPHSHMLQFISSLTTNPYVAVMLTVPAIALLIWCVSRCSAFAILFQNHLQYFHCQFFQLLAKSGVSWLL
jgi:hypothetical protein